MPHLQTARRFTQYAVAITWVATALPATVRAAESSPFAPAGNDAGSAPVAPDPLDGYEFAGYIRMGGKLQVYLAEIKSRRGQWLSLGVTSEGLVAEEFDAAQQSLKVRSGAHQRWLKLRGATVVAVPVVYRADRSIDWAHMALTDRQKEIKAAAQMWDLMEITRQARQPEEPARAPPTAARTVSPVR